MREGWDPGRGWVSSCRYVLGLQQCLSVMAQSPLGKERVETHVLGHLDEGEGILRGLSWQHASAEGRWQGAQAGGRQDLSLQRTHQATASHTRSSLALGGQLAWPGP